MKTASSDVRNSVYPRPRERNLTRGSVWPLLASKLSASLLYASFRRAREDRLKLPKPPERPSWTCETLKCGCPSLTVLRVCSRGCCPLAAPFGIEAFQTKVVPPAHISPTAT